MDNTQIAILVGAIAAQTVCMVLPFALGRRQGVAAGRQAGYEAAVEQLMPELDTANAQRDTARAKLAEHQAEHQAELRRCAGQLDAERRRNAETQAELRLQLEDRQVMAGEHALLLRHSARVLGRAELRLLSVGAPEVASEAHACARDLRALAEWADVTAAEVCHA